MATGIEIFWWRKNLKLRKGKKSNNDGFTLVEVVISLTIVAVMVAIIFSMLKISYSSAEKGEKAIVKNQRDRISSITFERQIASYCPYPPKQFFLGKSDKILFTTSYSVGFGSKAGVVLAEYNIIKDEEKGSVIKLQESLVMDEAIFTAYFSGDEFRINDMLNKTAKKEMDILQSDEDFKFMFFNKADGKWQESWDSNIATTPPVAVGIFMQGSDGLDALEQDEKMPHINVLIPAGHAQWIL